jgi:hypothetical protein
MALDDVAPVLAKELVTLKLDFDRAKGAKDLETRLAGKNAGASLVRDRRPGWPADRHRHRPERERRHAVAAARGRSFPDDAREGEAAPERAEIAALVASIRSSGQTEGK